MIFQNSIVQFLALFIPNKEFRHSFRAKYKRKTKYRKLRDDLLEIKKELRRFDDEMKIINSIKADQRNIAKDIKNHIDLRLNSYFNTFFDYKDIKYNNQDLRTLQIAKNIMLLELKYICDDSNIEYWLDFGTLVGAIRHKGFVPWDDDIDLGMMRKDYDNLETKIKKSNLIAKRVIAPDGTSFAKIYKKFKDFSINFDIFIYDYINSDSHEETKDNLIKNKKILSSVTKSLPKRIGTESFSFYDENKKEIEMALKNYLVGCNVQLDDGSHLANITNLWREYYLYNKASVFPLKKMMFEGTEHNVPNNVEEFLRVEFKDYMMLPNDTGKITHGLYFSNHDMKVLENFVNDFDKKQ